MLREATAVIEARARERHRQEMAAFEEKQARREVQAASGKKPRGRAPRPPSEAPEAKDQFNFTNPESRIMKAADGFQQSCNAQAAVEAGSRLIVSATVSARPTTEEADGDREAGGRASKEQLVPTLAATSPVIRSVAAVLVDGGFYSEAAVSAVEAGTDGAPGPEVHAATGRQPHGRTVAQLEKRDDPPAPEAGASVAAVMTHRLATKAGRQLYGLRKQTIEPVLGIIKEALGFRRFRLRGLGKARTEWTLVTLACNLKRLFHLGACLQAA